MSNIIQIIRPKKEKTQLPPTNLAHTRYARYARFSGLGDDSDHFEDVQTQRNVACDFHLRKRGLTIDALGEDAPGDFLRDGRLRELIPERLFGDLPCLFSAREIPTAPAFPGNIDLQVCSGLCGNAAKGERQSTQKTIQDGIVEFASHDAGLFYGESDLLLVMPALGQFARGVKPVCGFFFASPAYAVGSQRIRIAGSVVFRQYIGTH